MNTDIYAAIGVAAALLPVQTIATATATNGAAVDVRQYDGEIAAILNSAAMSSAGGEDNIALAREMLVAAAESGSPPVIRHLLAMEAVKLTTPATALTVVVPDSAPPPGFVPMAKVTASSAICSPPAKSLCRAQAWAR